MARFFRIFAAVATAAVIAAHAHAAPSSAPPGPVELDESRFLRSSELEAGDPIVGETCFRGNRIERFYGTIIGVEQGGFAGGNLIWAELESPALGDHSVAAGMSGSPVYVGGKLIGAVGYGFPSGQKPIAGITPIESMLEVLRLTERHPDPPSDPKPESTVGVWDIEELRSMALEARLPGVDPVTLRADMLPQSARDALPFGANSVELKPLSMPLSISSSHPDVVGPLREYLANSGIELTAGGIQGASTLEAEGMPELRAGSAVGMPLLTGDLTVGGFGTVTHREGDKLIAFGHPAFGWGTVDIPMSPCEMFAINPSYGMTFKLGQVATPIGAIRQDRLYGVGGIVGPVPSFLPMTVRVRSADDDMDKTFRYQVWENRFFTPMLAATGLSQAFAAGSRISGDSTVHTRYTVELADGKPLRKSLFYATTGSPSRNTVFSLLGDLAVLSMNPFEQADLEAIRIEIRIENGIRQASLVSVTADKDVYRPGETVRLTVYAQPYRGERQQREIEMALPADLQDGMYQLFIGDAGARLALDRMRAPGLFTPMNFEQLLDVLRIQYSGNNLYLVLSEPEPGLTVHGQELPSLPPSLRSTFTASSERVFVRPTTARFIDESVVEGDVAFQGSTRVNLLVSRTGRR